MRSEMTEEDWEEFSKVMREFSQQWQLAANQIVSAVQTISHWLNGNKELIEKLQKAFYCFKCGHHKNQHDGVGCNHGRGTWAECTCTEAYP